MGWFVTTTLTTSGLGPLAGRPALIGAVTRHVVIREALTGFLLLVLEPAAKRFV